MATANERMQKHRAKLRQQGLRPITIWVPDTRAPDYAAQCLRESRLIAEAERDDKALEALLDGAAADIEGWQA